MAVFSELIQSCANKTGTNKREVEVVINTFIEELLLTLCEKERAKISRFGTFEIRKRKNTQNGGYIKFRQSRLVSKLLSLTSGDTHRG